MKLFLLKTLLQRRARDEGFTLPMVIALGLVMLLLGTINIVKSNEENIAAINTNSSSDALAIAEVGVARYRELLNQNRILTIYDEDQWNDADADANDNVSAQACNDMTTKPPGWKDGGTAAAPNDTSKWWKIEEDRDNDGTAETIGEYRLVSYIYDNDGDTSTDNDGDFNVKSDADTDDDDSSQANYQSITDENDTDDDGESDAVGILTIQGRSTDDSEAQIQVDIPLRVNDLDNFAPLLWIGNGSITNTGGTDKLNLFNGNIIVSNSGGNCPPIADIDGNEVINDPRDLPDIINDPDGEALVPATGTTPEIPAVPAMANNKKNSIADINTSTSSSELLLPRPNSTSDFKNDDDRFYYRTANNVTIQTNNLVTDGVAKVTLYVDSADIDIVGPVTIGNFSLATTNVSSHNLEIYVDGNQTIDIDTSGGTVDIEAFIHAPDSTLNITGSGIVNIHGAIWVNEYNNTGGAEVNIRKDLTDTITGTESSYKFYTTSANRTPRPLTSNPTNWVREEVQ